MEENLLEKFEAIKNREEALVSKKLSLEAELKVETANYEGLVKKMQELGFNTVEELTKAYEEEAPKIETQFKEVASLLDKAEGLINNG